MCDLLLIWICKQGHKEARLPPHCDMTPLWSPLLIIVLCPSAAYSLAFLTHWLTSVTSRLYLEFNKHKADFYLVHH